ncbi:MAG TPA: hypothetical protein VGY56_07925 [Verrucomicrobiae bacterium]|nr:hypothetical protein [Verrucomicrobiae bacterium]
MKNNTQRGILRRILDRSPLGAALPMTMLTLCGLGATERAFGTGSWVAMSTSNPAGDSVGICVLLPDGTVLAEGSSSNWYSLAPDSLGHYTDGPWSYRNNSTWGHQTGSTAVLKNGNAFVAGGENGNGSPQVEIYHTGNGTWSTAINPAYFGKIQDGNAMVMPGGDVLIEPQGAVSPYSYDTFLFDPNNNSFSQTVGAPLQGIWEACWVKLPDDNVLCIDSDDSSTGGTTAEQYDPSSQTWGNAQSGIPNIWPNVSGTGKVSESGPAFLLPNENAIFFGGNGAEAVYNYFAGTWSSSAQLPGTLGQKDAPGAMMVNGKILLAVSPQGVNSSVGAINGVGPTSFYEYDYTANGGTGGLTAAPVAPSGYSQLSSRAQSLFMLDLPDGTVLLSGLGSQCWIYQPDGSPLPAGKPTIYSVSWNLDGSIHVTGTLFNGISGGASYGDDSQMDSNYPLLRFTDGSGNVTYGRSFNWSSTSVDNGNVVSTEAALPSNVFSNGGAAYSLQVVCNGIASDPVTFYGPVWVDFVNYNSIFQFGTFSFPYPTLPQGVSAVASGGTIAIDSSSQPSVGTVTAPYTITKPMNIISVYGPSTVQ